MHFLQGRGHSRKRDTRSLLAPRPRVRTVQAKIRNSGICDTRALWAISVVAGPLFRLDAIVVVARRDVVIEPRWSVGIQRVERARHLVGGVKRWRGVREVARGHVAVVEHNRAPRQVDAGIGLPSEVWRVDGLITLIAIQKQIVELHTHSDHECHVRELATVRALQHKESLGQDTKRTLDGDPRARLIIVECVFVRLERIAVPWAHGGRRDGVSLVDHNVVVLTRKLFGKCAPRECVVHAREAERQ
mmetsp:Transcript_184/g.361  ORF Transcript_184/g.361 Transcript_184/m.361 type:complete len:246 (-) Transcript_184:206-943(-)